MSRLMFLVAALIFGCREPQVAEAEEAGAVRADVTPPCEGCLVEMPKGSGGVPLLVVLHGDAEHARKWFDRWRGPALEHGYGILALECPVKLGCPDSSWYRWAGDPKWITDQVDAVAKKVGGIDKDRSILVGWSGGATYLSQHAERWHREFAGMVIHGGGVLPLSGQCAARSLPTYFLVGDKNWFHQATRELHAFTKGCGAEVVWDVTEGADHEAEDRLLDAARANVILEWVTNHMQPRVAG